VDADPTEREGVGSFEIDGAYWSAEEAANGEDWYHRWRGPLGAVVASCVLTDCVPIMNVLPKRDRPPGEPSHERHDTPRVERRPLSTAGHALSLCDGASSRDISDQLPFGDFTPGRWAWLLGDVKPTTERCPACWVDPETGVSSDGWEIPQAANTALCITCHGQGKCEPVPMRGRQGLWRPEWSHR